jgi:tRNA pseudouridine32 synthase / 23S rRNA pseudouridine746 synthase
METSGLLLLALHAEAQRRLGLQFERREVHKEYIAVVRGRLPHAAGSIDLPLFSDWPNRPRQKVDFLHGKAALTHYRCLEQPAEGDTTRLLLNPVTGRSHQLRVHLMHLGHPILGDRLYGDQLTVQSASCCMHAPWPLPIQAMAIRCTSIARPISEEASLS